MKTIIICGILKTICNNGGYLLLFGKRESQRFEISKE